MRSFLALIYSLGGLPLSVMGNSILEDIQDKNSGVINDPSFSHIPLPICQQIQNLTPYLLHCNSLVQITINYLLFRLLK